MNRRHSGLHEKMKNFISTEEFSIDRCPPNVYIELEACGSARQTKKTLALTSETDHNRWEPELDISSGFDGDGSFCHSTMVLEHLHRDRDCT
jgi:hypothetical protein